MRLDASTVSVSSDPANEPLTTAEAKTHIRLEHDDDDSYVDTLIVTAREACEMAAWRKLITQTLVGGLDQWPEDHWFELPYPPLQSVTSITYVDDDGNNNTVSTDVYGVDTKRHVVYLKNDQTWPADTLRTFDPITVTWVAGYGDDASDVPAIYKHAIKFLIGHFYENREEVLTGSVATRMETAARHLLGINKAY